MADAGWYRDPGGGDRLRYWDGTGWTRHVSRDGAMTQEPLAGSHPPPPPQAPPAGRDYPPTPLGRAGFAVAALGGVLAAATSGVTAVEQEGFATISVAGGSWLGVVAAALCVAAAVAPWASARIAGLGVAVLFGFLVAFALIGFRTSDDLVPGEEVSLASGGWLLLAGSLLLLGGAALALWGLRRPAAGPDPARAPKEGKGVAALALGIVGLLIPVTAAPAAGLGLLALDDDRVSGGRVGGRGMAVAGLVLGIVALSLWTLGLTLGMLLAQP